MTKIAAMRAEVTATFEQRLSDQASAHRREVVLLGEENSELRRQLTLAQHSLTALVGEKESSNWTTATRFLMGKQALSKKNIFTAWRRRAASEKADRLLCHIAVKRFSHHLKTRVLIAWYRFVHGTKAEQFAERANGRLKIVTSEIVARYESELDKLKAQIQVLETQVIEGRRRRVVLEDELRRTLLKGMVSFLFIVMLSIASRFLHSRCIQVTMNLETLNIFSSAAASDVGLPTAAILDDSCPVPRADPPNPETIRLLTEQQRALASSSSGRA